MGAGKRRWGPLLSFPLVGGALTTTPDWEQLGKRWWSHVEFLADDRREGRETGSRGHAEAADYMADQFRAVGLAPAGVRGYRQAVDLDVVSLDRSRCALELVHAGGTEPLSLESDAAFLANTQTPEHSEAEAVFVGYGLTVPELNYDDLAGQDLQGKVAVYVMGGPPEMPASVKAHYQFIYERRKFLRRAGVVGTVAIPNPKASERPWSRVAASGWDPKMELRDPGPDVPPPLPLVLWFNTDRAELLFAHSGRSFQEVLAALHAGGPLPRFPLRVKIRARVGMSRTRVTSDNVVGVLPGSDPKLRHEYVVVSAHLDHVGIGEPIGGDRIYHGAMDDASGDASLIEVARALKDSGARPRRSILFLSVTAEEKGLLGSLYFAAHPTVAGPLVADLNLDCFLPIFPLKYLEVQGLGESTLGDDIRSVAGAVGVEVLPDPEPEHNFFIRSDQYSFIRQGVPGLMFRFSCPPGAPEEKLFKTWLAERYHAPSDDVHQPVERAGAAQFNSILANLALRVADADERPAWKPDSFFRRFVR